MTHPADLVPRKEHIMCKRHSITRMIVAGSGDLSASQLPTLAQWGACAVAHTGRYVPEANLSKLISETEQKGTDLNGTYLTFFGCPFLLTSALAAERVCISIG